MSEAKAIAVINEMSSRINTRLLRVLVAHGQIGTHRSAGRTEGELAAADEVESANASFSVRESLPTTLRRLNHRRDRLRDILCPLATLSCSRKGTAAPSLLLQLAVQGPRATGVPTCVVQTPQNASDRRGIVAGGEVASIGSVLGDCGKASTPKSGWEHRSYIAHFGLSLIHI